MAKTRDGLRQLSCWVKDETFARIEALAERMGRPLGSEVQHALERHADNPPTVQAPAHPPAEVPPPEKPLGKKRGPKAREE